MAPIIDHRLLADEMDLYVLDEEIGAGLPLWLPNGVVIRDQLEAFIKDLEHREGYQRVVSPHVAKQDLYEKSGHLQCFAENMFPPMRWPEESSLYFLKPMNCPHHHKIFQAKLRSYRQLPLRLAEYGQVYRYENSGSLRGLSRVRGLCQNDAHIYVEADKALDEILSVLDLHEECYRKIGLKGYRYRLSRRSEDSSFQGALNDWLRAEDLLRQALLLRGLEFFEAPGEAAFYGPKIDVQMKMASGSEESVASVQVDFVSAERFDLNYIDRGGQRARPWILHRAPLGSHERFVALLLEYFQGQLPAWLAPVQLVLFPVSEADAEFCQNWQRQLQALGLRVLVDENPGRLAKRILWAHRLRPWAKIVVGAKERSSGLFELQGRDEDVSLSAEQVQESLLLQCRKP